VSRAGYYAWKKRPAAPRHDADAELTELIAGTHQAHRGGDAHRTYDGPAA